MIYPLSDGPQKLADVLESHGAQGYIPLQIIHLQTRNGWGGLLLVLGDTMEAAQAPIVEIPEKPEEFQVQPVSTPLPEPEVIPAPVPKVVESPVERSA
jgi:hypothetical protein